MPPQGYLDVDLEIERVGEQYQAELDSPCGQAHAVFAPPFSALEIENIILRLGQVRRGVRRIDTPEVEAAKTFGSRLFGAVFTQSVRDCLIKSLDQANSQGLGLRIRLRLNKAPDLAGLPWEYLYYPDLNRFFALSTKTPVVRYLELPERIRPLRIEPPLRVLAVVSSPSDAPPLDVEREWQNIQTALAGPVAAGTVQLERLAQPTLGALGRALRRTSFHCLHFVGHGAFDPQRQDGLLIFEGEGGDAHRVSGQDLGMLLHDFDSLRLVVLNACEGGRAASDDPFGGVAQSLVQQGCPAVIAMQFPISDGSAIRLSQSFYGALGGGTPVDTALGIARQELFAASPSLDWGTPVLYLRAPDGRVFDIGESVLAGAKPAGSFSRAGAEPARASSLAPAAPERHAPPLKRPRRLLAAVAAVAVLVLLSVVVGRTLLKGGDQPAAMRPTPSLPTAPAERPTAALTPQPTDAPTAAPVLSATAQPTADAALFYAGWGLRGQPLEAGVVLNSVAVSPDSLIAVAGADGLIRIWRASDRVLLRTLSGHSGRVSSVAFSPDGALLASAGSDATIRLWRATDWETVRTLGAPFGHSGPVQVVAFSHSGDLLASGSDDTTVRLWRVQDGTFLRTFEGHSASVWGVAFSPDDRLLASSANEARPSGRDTDVLLWNVGDATLAGRFSGHSAGVMSVAFSPDGTLLASGSWDATARIWSVDGFRLLQVLEGHPNGAGWVVFAPDGLTLATAAGDGNARIWRARDGRLLRAFEGHTGWATSVAFAPDGRLLVSASGDGTLRLWGAE
ncbi:MAG TPA: CHAT domain-containing protein [Roseiflexaceae bacterium]|nr:CHAT domain-containing protein [Roseiflexaceae bacterium]